MKKYFSFLLIAAAACLMLAACSPAKNESPTSANTPTESANTNAQETTQEQAQGAVPEQSQAQEQEQGAVPEQSQEQPQTAQHTPERQALPASSEYVAIDAASLKNNIINEPLEKEIWVYLPQDYEAGDKRYPVLYFLPGYSENLSSYSDKLAELMTALISGGDCSEIIVVGVPGKNKFGGSFYVNSPITGNWEDFVTIDVIDYIDENYRTIAKAESRGLVGFSMGGFGAWNLAMLHPEIFGCAYAMSPGVFDAGNVGAASNIEPGDRTFTRMSDEEAIEEYEYIISGNRADFTLAYGSAFAYNMDARPPYIDYVTKDTPEMVSKWDSGYGNVVEKVAQYSGNLKQLKAFAIDYGTRDFYAWIPDGCRFLSEQLTAAGIEHVLLDYDGGHGDKFFERFETAVIPFFMENLA